MDNEFYIVMKEAETDKWQQQQPAKNEPNHPQWELPRPSKRSGQKRLIEVRQKLL